MVFIYVNRHAVESHSVARNRFLCLTLNQRSHGLSVIHFNTSNSLMRCLDIRCKIPSVRGRYALPFPCFWYILGRTKQVGRGGPCSLYSINASYEPTACKYQCWLWVGGEKGKVGAVLCRETQLCRRARPDPCSPSCPLPPLRLASLLSIWASQHTPCGRAGTTLTHLILALNLIW